MKKVILLLVLIICCVGCTKNETKPSETITPTKEELVSPTPTEIPKQIKIGLICTHDEGSITDSKYISNIQQAFTALGLENNQIIVKTNIPEDEFSLYDDVPSATYEAIKSLADIDVNVIFTYGNREESIKKYAIKFPNIQFCILTDCPCAFESTDNVHYAYVNIYEGKFLNGVASGLKLNEMIMEGKITEDQALLGFVGGNDNTVNEYTYKSFYLGAKSVCPSVKMKLTFTNCEYDETAEKEGTYRLINKGCVIITQMGNSLGCPTVCESNRIPNIPTYPTINLCPNTYMCSAYIDWTNYFKYVYECITTDKKIENWADGLASIRLSKVNPKIEANGTQDKIEELIADIKNGRLIIDPTDTHITNGIERE